MLRPIRRRALVCGISTAVLLGLATAGSIAPAAADPEFRPQLVTVDTLNRADKALLRRWASTSPSTPGTTTSKWCCTPPPTWPR